MSPIACPHEDSPTTVWMCPSCFDKLEKLEAINRELVEALERHQKRMKLINGPDEKCCHKNVLICENHALIHQTDDLLRRAREGGK